MHKNKKIIGIVPARGSSKRIPRKNIRLLAGKPLITYTIEAALGSKYINRTIVSTDNEEIATVSKKCGAEVIKRPKILSTGRAGTIDAIFHVLDILKRENYNPGIIVLLQPTSPSRTTGDINKALKLFLNSNSGSLISVSESRELPFWMHNINKKGFIKPLLGSKDHHKQRQDLPKTYTVNGAIYITTPKNLHKYSGFHTKKTSPYIMPPEKSIDIDDEIDFKLAELIIKNGKNKNKK